MHVNSLNLFSVPSNRTTQTALCPYTHSIYTLLPVWCLATAFNDTARASLKQTDEAHFLKAWKRTFVWGWEKAQMGQTMGNSFDANEPNYSSKQKRILSIASDLRLMRGFWFVFPSLVLVLLELVMGAKLKLAASWIFIMHFYISLKSITEKKNALFP